MSKKICVACLVIYGREARKLKYGYRHEELEAMLRRQGSVCPICDAPISLERYGGATIDHDHSLSGRESVRSVTCVGCNLSVGYVEKGKWRVNVPPRIKRYLERWQETLQNRAMQSAA